MISVLGTHTNAAVWVSMGKRGRGERERERGHSKKKKKKEEKEREKKQTTNLLVLLSSFFSLQPDPFNFDPSRFDKELPKNGFIPWAGMLCLIFEY